VSEVMESGREWVRAAGWNVCVVVNEQHVVLGLLREQQLQAGEDGAPAESVMRPGPSTFRPNVPIHEMANFMIEHDLESAPVTTSDVRLAGLLRRADAAKLVLVVHQHE